MTDPQEIGFATQVRALPRQLLLALLNGTAILVIVASILALIAISKIEGLASNIATTMTEAVLSRVKVDPQVAFGRLQGLTTEVRALAAAVKDAKVEVGAPLLAQVEELNGRLGALQASVARLNDSRSVLIESAFTAIGRSLADSLERLRGCSMSAT